MLNKKDKERLEELNRIPPYRLTESEKAELEALEEKKSDIIALADAFKSYLADIPTLKVLSNIPHVTQNDSSNDPAYRIHALMCGIKNGNRDLIAKAADPMTVGTPADGGYLVPAITQAKILELVPTYGQARKIMTVYPTSGNDENIPKEANLPAWYWVGEAAAITSSKPTLGVMTLNAKKGAAIVILSKELFNDANVSIGTYIVNKIAQVKGQAEDIQFFRGTGSPFTGVASNSHTFGNVVTLTGAASTLTYQKLLDCVYGIDQNFLSGAKWILHRTVVNVVRGLTDLQQRPLFIDANAGTPAQLMGYPAELIEAMPTSATASNATVAMLGNFQNSLIGDVNDMEVELLREATIAGTNLAEYDLVGFKVTSRVKFNAGVTEMYSRIRQAA